MGKIIGSPEIIEKAKQLTPLSGKQLINWELIESLPDSFSAQIVPLEFDIEKDFVNVGTSKDPIYYPHIDFMYRIGDCAGIKASDKINVEPIYEEVNVSTMEMEHTPVIMKKKVGYMVTKQAIVMNQDGTSRPISPRTSAENAWDYCEKLWTSEEEATEGYTKTEKDKYGNIGYYYTWNGEKKFKKLLYNTKWKRRKSFLDRLEKTASLADSKAWGKCIREAVGLTTGFSPDKLSDGVLYFAKIRRSEEAMKMENAAYLDAIRNGTNSNRASELLFGSTEIDVTNSESAPFAEPAPEPVPVPEQKSQVDQVSETFGEPKTSKMYRILKHYIETKETAQAIEDWDKATKLLSWLETGPDLDKGSNQKWFDDAIEVLKKIEAALPEFFRETHDLY